MSNVAWDDGAIFDGTSVCGSANVSETFRTPPVTISAWLTPASRDDETTNAYALTPFPPNAVSGDVPGSGGYALGLDVWTDGKAGRAIAIESGAGAQVAFHSIDVAFASGERHFVVVVIGTGDATVYVDGKSITQTTSSIPPSITPTPLHLGCHNDDVGYGSKRFYKGRMRDVRIFKRVLSSDEVAQLFSNGPVQ